MPENHFFCPWCPSKFALFIIKKRRGSHALLHTCDAHCVFPNDSLTQSICEANGLLVVPTRKVRTQRVHRH